MSGPMKSNAAETMIDAESALRIEARAAAGAVFKELLQLSRDAQSESVKLAAIKEVLDRAFGRAGPADKAGGVIAHVLVDDGYRDVH